MENFSLVSILVGVIAILIQMGGTTADEGCNGDGHGIPCCYMGFAIGDNSGGKERFVQSNEYTEQSCFETCKKLYPKSSIGLTESLHAKYSSGNGTNKHKCWCEFGEADRVVNYLDPSNKNYQTCMFERPEALALTKSNPVLNDCLAAGGFFFGHGGGRMKVKDNFKVGDNLEIELEMNARSKDGLLLAVQGTDDYSVLELVDGTLIFRVDNGDGPIVSKWEPNHPDYFMQDPWYKVKARKMQNIVDITVDDVQAEYDMKGKETYADTNDALYLGGHGQPHLIKDFPGNFEGCLKDVTINNERVAVTEDMLAGDVHVPNIYQYLY